MLDLTSPVHW